MIGYYQVKSPLSQMTEENAAAFIVEVSRALGEELKKVSADEYAASDFALLYVASGGSEGYFKQIWNTVSEKRCYILTSGQSNSLAAAMEILSFIHQNGGEGEIIHGAVADIAARIRSLQATDRALATLHGARIGMIGDPSDWLIASKPFESELKQKLGITVVHISVNRLAEEAEKKKYIPNTMTEELIGKGFDFGEMQKAFYVYGALKRICEQERLNAVTVRCFDLLDRLKTTTCLGMALLNCEGITTGCEGDMPSLLAMMITQAVTGKGAFMCNPSRIDPAAKKAVFAHCTLPLTMPDRYDCDTHFESGIGVAIRGHFDPATFTIFKCSGDLSDYHVQVAQSEPMDWDPNLCRTQITVNLEDPYYFLRQPIGNHHVFSRGDNRQQLIDLMDRINSAY